MTSKEAHTRYNQSAKGIERRRRYGRRRRARLKEAGLCVDCRKSEAAFGYVKCEECMHRDRERLWLNQY